MSSGSATPQEVEQYVLVASDASNPQHQQQANVLLHQWVSSNSDTVISDTILEVLRSSKREVVLFYALTVYLRLDNATPHQRVIFRQELLTQLLPGTVAAASKYYHHSAWGPSYLRTKVGVLFSHFLKLDFPHDWPSAFDDLTDPRLLQTAPDIFLRTLAALMDDFGKNETEHNSRIKNFMRGYTNPHQPDQMMVASPRETISSLLIQAVLSLLEKAIMGDTESINGGDRESRVQVGILSLTALKGFMSWVDLMLVLDQKVLHLVFEALAKGSKADSDLADGGVAAIECMEELIARGMEDDKKIFLLQHTSVLEKIRQCVDLKVVDASPIDVVMEVAKFINRTGLEVVPILRQKQQSTPEDGNIRSQILEIFFQCFAYDDIDVSGAVIPLAGTLISESVEHDAEGSFLRLLSATYAQMKYPMDFQFDFEDDDEAEEEVYRTELRKLNQKLVRANPELCLQFLGQALSKLPLPLSIAPTPDVEVAINLIYQYCEGIRPPPGMKVVMRNDMFRNLLVGLHMSDIVQHPHREVLILYYETSVRYYPILRERPDLLQLVLQAMTGPRGLQHENQKLRSRCCYLLLRLIKSVGSNNSSNDNVLRPYVETAISGIQLFLECSAAQLRSDDALNLFETIGLLLGKTGLSSHEQQQYLAQVMTPHVRSIETALIESQQAFAEDAAIYGERLSNSIAAIAYLSKGFKRPPPEVQAILLETSQIAMTVLETLPGNDMIRNKTFVFAQRLIQCLEDKILPAIPRMLFLLITNCTAEDILDVSQLMNQLCIKFRANAIGPLEASLLPFLRKCHYLSTKLVTESSREKVEDEVDAPHLRTEQLSIEKLSYVVLQHVVVHRATAILLSPTNVSNLETILQTMSNGAIHAGDPVVKKSCLVFFRELLDQWVPSAGGTYTESPTVFPSTVIVQGLVRFFCDTLLPGMLQVFLTTTGGTFDVNDANNYRCLAEFSGMMEIIKNRLPDIYRREIIVSKFTLQTSSQDVIDGFHSASTKKEFETMFKSLIQQRTKSQT